MVIRVYKVKFLHFIEVFLERGKHWLYNLIKGKFGNGRLKEVNVARCSIKRMRCNISRHCLWKSYPLFRLSLAHFILRGIEVRIVNLLRERYHFNPKEINFSGGVSRSVTITSKRVQGVTPDGETRLLNYATGQFQRFPLVVTIYIR